MSATGAAAYGKRIKSHLRLRRMGMRRSSQSRLVER
jgi:hypothetical protein